MATGLEQFGFREVTAKEEAARKAKIAACDHLAHADHTTIVYRHSGYADILSSHSVASDGGVYVTCRACRGSWAAASVTELGARRIADALRTKCRGRYLDTDTKAQFREMARDWDAYRKLLATKRQLRCGTPIR